jgi:hypothetical protein
MNKGTHLPDDAPGRGEHVACIMGIRVSNVYGASSHARSVHNFSFLVSPLFDGRDGEAQLAVIVFCKTRVPSGCETWQILSSLEVHSMELAIEGQTQTCISNSQGASNKAGPDGSQEWRPKMQYYRGRETCKFAADRQNYAFRTFESTSVPHRLPLATGNSACPRRRRLGSFQRLIFNSCDKDLRGYLGK